MSEKLIQCEECGTEHPVDECGSTTPPPDKQPAAETLEEIVCGYRSTCCGADTIDAGTCDEGCCDRIECLQCGRSWLEEVAD